MKHTQIHRCKRAQCLELKQRNSRLFITFAQVTAILYLAGFLTKYVATKNCSHLTEERPNGKVSRFRKSHYRRKSSGKIESVEKEGRKREKKQWLHSVFKLATLSEKTNNGGRKRSILPWQYAFLEIQLDIYTHKSITTTTMYLFKEI